ncbi:MAG TPA: serine hydrolase domain-containing protein [Capillimicrobium sp.]|jgi:D-alanyl-D-alanine carboxypeptidase
MRYLHLIALTAVLTLAGASAAPAKRLDAQTRAQLDRALAQTMQANWAPGVIAGVWVKDRGWTAARGLTARGGGHRPTLGDHTRIGSVTKTFTGTLILQLVDEGKLSLDDTIDRWFPTFPNASAITVGMLGTMASGISSYTLDPQIADTYLASPTTVWTPDQLIDAAASLPPVFPPGQGFQYSNSNFVMLGQIVEQVTGKPFAQALDEMILEPLKLTETSFSATSALPRPSWRAYTAQGSTTGNILDATRWSPTFAATAGQMISTLGDLRTWTRALGRGTLLEPRTQRIRLQPNPHSAAGGREYDFAIGNDHGWLAHDGQIPGYNTQVAYLPKLDATIVVMANSDIASATGTIAPQVFTALAKVIAPPGNVPTG